MNAYKNINTRQLSSVPSEGVQVSLVNAVFFLSTFVLQSVRTVRVDADDPVWS